MVSSAILIHSQYWMILKVKVFTCCVWVFKFRFCLRPTLSRSLMPDLNLEVTCWIYYWDVLNTICPPSRPKCDNLVQHVRHYCLPLVISIRFALLKLPSIPRWWLEGIVGNILQSNCLNKNELRESNGINRIMNNHFQMSGTAPGCCSCYGFTSEFHDYRRRCMDIIIHLPQIFRPCCLEYIATCNIVMPTCVCMIVYVCRFVCITGHGVFFVAMPGGR